ncbi:hypothetical protein C942_03745 [Photobacterium marinum]|uniref:Lipoprotein n=1 Tax=Photobacterium marinum TaxID=1056511 RepID=L8J7J9_9GAMM|nr:hypothetical protein [Photobacterium marinum]ELR63452.1 hypothetical protein C942_03745 [Photobacterium marinum]
MMKLKKLTLGLACLLLAACSEPEKPSSTEAEAPEVGTPTEQTVEQAETEAPEPAEPLATDIWQAPTELTLSGVTVNLRSDLWLNSMPVIGDDGTQPAIKLQASVKLQSTDMKPLPGGIEITQVLLEQGDKQWLVNENLEVRGEGELTLEVVMQAGPEWESGSLVNVAIIFNFDGEEHRLVERDVAVSQVF